MIRFDELFTTMVKTRYFAGNSAKTIEDVGRTLFYSSRGTHKDYIGQLGKDEHLVALYRGHGGHVACPVVDAQDEWQSFHKDFLLRPWVWSTEAFYAISAQHYSMHVEQLYPEQDKFYQLTAKGKEYLDSLNIAPDEPEPQAKGLGFPLSRPKFFRLTPHGDVTHQ